MSTIEELMKSMRKQNQILKGNSGLSSFQNLVNSFREQKYKTTYPLGLSAITSSTKSISQFLKPANSLSEVMGKNIISLAAANQFPKNNFAWSLSTSLMEIAKHNQLLSDKLSSYASSQLFLSNNLAQIAKAMNQSHLNKFNSFEIAIQGISRTYLREIVKSKDWEEIDFAEQVNETIIAASEVFLSNSTQITTEDIDNFKSSIIDKLLTLLSKTSTKKAASFIFHLLSVISILLTMYSVYQQKSDKTNQDVIDETTKQIEKVRIETKQEFKNFTEEISKKIEFELSKLYSKRTATTNVNLRKSPVNNSPIIGLVKIGQDVVVIEIQNKYLLISYQDKDTGEPKSGFVIKKYFN